MFIQFSISFVIFQVATVSGRAVLSLGPERHLAQLRVTGSEPPLSQPLTGPSMSGLAQKMRLTSSGKTEG